MTYQIYIGSDNTTSKLELEQIEAVLAKYHEGFTITTGLGYWHGVKEDTAIVLVDDLKSRVMKTINELKAVLHQEAIAYQEVTALRFI